jgi:hypothetical protein
MDLTKNKKVKIAGEIVCLALGIAVVGTIVSVMGTAFVLYRIFDRTPMHQGATL